MLFLTFILPINEINLYFWPMKLNIVLTFLTFISFNLCLFSQAGINVQYLNTSGEYSLNNKRSHGISLGIDYKSLIYKTSFTIEPGISYSRNFFPTEETYLDYLSLDFPIQLYPVNLTEDCKCPTFKKKTFDFFEHLFLEVTPSAYANVSPYQGYDAFAIKKLFLGFGIGLDIPLNNAYILTPVVRYQPLSWNWSDSSEADNKPLNERIFSLGLDFRYLW